VWVVRELTGKPKTHSSVESIIPAEADGQLVTPLFSTRAKAEDYVMPLGEEFSEQLGSTWLFMGFLREPHPAWKRTFA
jgi:hypothetical protein